MKTTLTIIILGAIVGLTLVHGYDNQMKANCTKLQNQAVENAENPHYFISQLDHDECLNVYKIDIDAPIK